jgi:GTP-binding protein Era
MSHRAGFVAIVGRPNVGKSTLLNALVGTKVAIVTPKPQTTRNRIVGIRTLADAQALFVDTPGIHDARSPLNRRMVDVARRALAEADVVLLVVDAHAGATGPDRELAAALAPLATPVVVAVNKIDRIAKPALLPLLGTLGAVVPGRDLVPVSARSGDGVDVVLRTVTALLPEGPRLHPEEHFTAETERFLVQETIREQVFLATEEEVPYGTAVVVEEWTEKPDQELLVVHATILVERDNHKGMIIGTGGQQLKEIGQRARQALERLFGHRVYLELFVRVEPGWSRDPRRLAELGL